MLSGARGAEAISTVEEFEDEPSSSGGEEYGQYRKHETDYPSIIAVLAYLKKSFEDEALLDNLPLDAAGNQGAWHAWQAHRKGIEREKFNDIDSSARRAITREPQSSTTWNWDGVWADRVKKGVSNSISDSVLYGNAAGDSMVCRPSF